MEKVSKEHLWTVYEKYPVKQGKEKPVTASIHASRQEIYACHEQVFRANLIVAIEMW